MKKLLAIIIIFVCLVVVVHRDFIVSFIIGDVDRFEGRQERIAREYLAYRKGIAAEDIPMGRPNYEEGHSSLALYGDFDFYFDLDGRIYTVIHDGNWWRNALRIRGPMSMRVRLNIIQPHDVVIDESIQPQTRNPKSIDEAVSFAIKTQSLDAYYKGEIATEGHIILDVEEIDGIIKVYTIACFGYFGFENGIFTKISGSGAIPTVITFSKNEKGEYSLLEYKEPMDGALYIDSLKKMFPKKLYDTVLSADRYYPDLVRQEEAEAAKYLKSIGRAAKVSGAYVEKKLVNINVQASNRLFGGTEFPFLNEYPFWIGTRERIENGVRNIYETSQSKTSDGYDLVIFRKTKEDGTIVEEYKFKIVESEPQLIE